MIIYVSFSSLIFELTFMLSLLLLIEWSLVAVIVKVYHVLLLPVVPEILIKASIRLDEDTLIL